MGRSIIDSTPRDTKALAEPEAGETPIIAMKGGGRRGGRRSAGSQLESRRRRLSRKVLARLGPGGRAATTTLAELVDEYLEMHQSEPVTIAKQRRLLEKATAALGEMRLADLLDSVRLSFDVGSLARASSRWR